MPQSQPNKKPSFLLPGCTVTKNNTARDTNRNQLAAGTEKAMLPKAPASATAT